MAGRKLLTYGLMLACMVPVCLGVKRVAERYFPHSILPLYSAPNDDDVNAVKVSEPFMRENPLPSLVRAERISERELKIGGSTYKFDNPAQLSRADDIVRNALLALRDFYALPYVGGGETGKPLEEALNDEKLRQHTTLKQPGGSFRSGHLTQPGFDCSGLIWHIYNWAGIGLERMAAEGYRNSSECIAAKKADDNADELLDKAMPGDILFLIGKEGKASYVMLYLGDGYFIESAGRKPLDLERIPESVYDAWANKYGKPPTERGGIRLGYLSNEYPSSQIELRRLTK